MQRTIKLCRLFRKRTRERRSERCACWSKSFGFLTEAACKRLRFICASCYPAANASVRSNHTVEFDERGACSETYLKDVFAVSYVELLHAQTANGFLAALGEEIVYSGVSAYYFLPGVCGYQPDSKHFSALPE